MGTKWKWKEGSSSGGRGTENEDVDVVRRLELHEDDGDDFIWEEEVERHDVQAKWLAIVRVHTNKVLARQLSMQI
jgi:hypothetical protein